MQSTPAERPTYWMIEALSDGVVVRRGLDDGHVRRLVAVLEHCPPILITEAGEIIDGRHRVEAARRSGWVRVPALILHDEQPAAELLAAMAANASHGLPLSRQERRAGVRAVLHRRPDLSDRAIAQTCGVARSVVAAVRAEARGSGGGDDHLNARTGADGKRYRTIDWKTRSLLEATVLLHPQRSVRQLAATGSVSIGTAQAHRSRVLTRTQQEGVLKGWGRKLWARWILWRHDRP